MNDLLMFRARGRLCGLPLEHVVETMRPLPIEPVASAAAGVLGVAVIRGGPVPVLDVGTLLEAEGQTAPTRFVLVRVADRRVALAVDEVAGIRAVSPEALSTLPPLLRRSTAPITAIGAVDDELVVILSAARAVPEGVR